MGKKLTAKEFIEKAKKIHGDKYNYSKINYIDSHTPITIICPIHGEFKQVPNSHLSGYGCKYCGYERLKLYRLSNTDEFINKAKKIHGDKYNYSKVNYIDSHTPVTIICPTHGEFKQVPSYHLSGNGCDKCGKTYQYNTEEFIEKAKKIHGDKYDYSKAKYIDSHTQLIVTCPIHGEFLITPNNHLRNRGCPKCHQSKNEKEILKKLKENNIIFEYQKHFDWLLKQSLDFYLPNYNVAIECQGEQHFIFVNFSGKWTDIDQKSILIDIQNRDKNKFDLCLEHNTKIYYYLSNRTIKRGHILNYKNDFYKDKFITNDVNEIIKELKKHEK